MPVYVDNVRLPSNGTFWCHLVADSLDELHAFAYQLGLKPQWFQHTASYPHYDVTISMREKALKMGASEGNRATIFECAQRLKAEFIKKSQIQHYKQLRLFA
jgi:hypothetical protein